MQKFTAWHWPAVLGGRLVKLAMRVLVTGGGGFIGRHLVQQLVQRGATVRSLGRRPQAELAQLGVEVLCGDLTDADFLYKACAGMEAVFHVAAKAGIWGPRSEYYAVNVTGTDQLLRACQRAGVRRFVYTSTPSVVFNRRPHRGSNESIGYGSRWLCHYAETKALAEQRALAANSPTMGVAALRPHLVFGPGDPHLLPKLLESIQAGRLKIVGDGRNQVDVSYVEDVVAAHLNALDALTKQPEVVGGQAYFISQDQPVNLWDWLNRILSDLGHAPLTRKVPLPVAYAAGGASEFVWSLLKKRSDPPMTRFVAVELAKSHYFNIAAAKEHLGYRPRFAMERAIEHTVADLRQRGFAADTPLEA